MTRPPTNPPKGSRKPPPPPAPPNKKKKPPRFIDRLMDLSAQGPQLAPSEQRLLEIIGKLLPGMLIQARFDAGDGVTLGKLNADLVSAAVNYAVIAAVEVESRFHEIRDNARGKQ